MRPVTDPMTLFLTMFERYDFCYFFLIYDLQFLVFISKEISAIAEVFPNMHIYIYMSAKFLKELVLEFPRFSQKKNPPR